ncbi:MAG TPA: glutamyl-tRNA reductase [Candidatus Eremiobacteraceae bacterium]|nr:glutamyl-tRNA reductase [Candidatus Eremiobacteraceae bacterium]
MEPTLMVVGLNYRTAPVGVRERFWISEDRRYQVLVQLSRAEGIDEVIVLATCNRTEFLLWVNDVTLAANSVMRLLGAEYGLKLCEWKHFYRLLDEAALLHIFRVASSLDSMVVGEPQVISQVKQAWQQAQKVGVTGRFLDAVMQKALTVSKRVRSETAIGNAAVSIPYAAVELTRQIFGTLENKKVLLLGAGKMCELSARGLLNRGASSVKVINRTLEHAAELATKLGGQAISFEERWQHMAEADIIISSTSCPHTILSREEAELMLRGRKDRPLVIVDIAMPRDIDSAVREVKGVFLYDLDDLENVVDHNTGERETAAAEAQKILQAEAQGFRRKLMAERVVPTIVALRQRLDEICRQELDSFRQENGPFSKDQDEMLDAVMSRMTQRVAGSLARELKELPEKVEQEKMTAALRRLFHLQTPQAALVGTISQ